MLVPLYGFLEGDTLGVLVLAEGAMSLAVVAEKVLVSARTRVRHAGPLEVWANGKNHELTQTVDAAGLTALDRVDVRPRRAPSEGP